jgi:hypothetical protein
MSFAQPASQTAHGVPLTTAAEAERVAAHLLAVMDRLVEVLERETALVRAGHLSAAGKLEGGEERACPPLRCRHTVPASEPSDRGANPSRENRGSARPP